MKRIPLARIMIPYVAGIICLLQGLFIPRLHCIFALSLGLLCLTLLLRNSRNQTPAIRDFFFSASLYCFLFLLAFETAGFYDARTKQNHYTHYLGQKEQKMIATISDIPVSREKTLKLNVVMDAIHKDGNWHTATGHVMVYVRQPVPIALNTGDQILINTKLSEITAPQNPGEPDYRQILTRKNIFHTAYVKTGELWLTGQKNNNRSLTRLGISVREFVVNTLRDVGLSQEAFSICTALLVGYDDEISSGVMQSFSHSGTLHILSVSGMHTGILYLVLMLLCDLVDPYKRYLKSRAAFIIAVMLIFVAVTGFSPSVLRAALMLTLVLTGQTINRRGNAYNTLLFSAFLLLLYNPFLLTDVGFLLSYLAVGGIMYLYPLLNRLWSPGNSILKFFWDMNLMSIAATLFTLPVTLYYFHQFPVWFMVSNLIIIPLSTALMGASFLLLLFHKVLVLKQCLVWAVDRITAIMLRTAQLTDDPVYGYIDTISFGVTDVVFCSLFIIMMLWFFSSRSYRILMATLTCAILWLTVSSALFFRQSSAAEFVVFSVRNKSVYLLRTGQQAYLRADSLTEAELHRNIKPYLLRYPDLRLQYSHERAWQIGSRRIISSSEPFQGFKPVCDYLIVSHNTFPDPEALRQIKPLVIADCSNSYTFVKKLRKQCADLGISFYSVKEQGAFLLPLSGTDHETADWR